MKLNGFLDHGYSEFVTLIKKPSNIQRKSKKNKLIIADNESIVINSYNNKSRQSSDLKSFDNSRFECSYCEKLFSSKSLTNSHIFKVHNRLLPYTCNQCGQNYATKRGASLHMKKFHQKMYQCKYCGKQFDSKFLLNKHQKTSDCNEDGFKSKKWSKQYIDKNKRPIKSKMPIKPIDSNIGNGKPVVSPDDNSLGEHCPSCNVWFPTTKMMRIHFDIIHNMLAYKCDLCLVESSTEQNAFSHVKLHERQTSYCCKQCNVYFSKQSFLANHMFKLHSIIQWLNCNMCNLKYKYQTSLNRHKNKIHGDSNNTKRTTNHKLCQRYYKSFNKSTNVQNEYIVPCSSKIEVSTNFNEDCHQSNGLVDHEKVLNKCTIPSQVIEQTMVQTNNFKPEISTNKTVMTRLQVKMAMEQKLILPIMNNSSYFEANQIPSEIENSDYSVVNNDNANKLKMDDTFNCETYHMLSEIEQKGNPDLHNNSSNAVDMVQDDSSDSETNEILSKTNQNSCCSVVHDTVNETKLDQLFNCETNKMLSETKMDGCPEIHNNSLNDIAISLMMDGTSDLGTNRMPSKTEQNIYPGVHNKRPNEMEISLVMDGTSNCKTYHMPSKTEENVQNNKSIKTEILQLIDSPTVYSKTIIMNESHDDKVNNIDIIHNIELSTVQKTHTEKPRHTKKHRNRTSSYWCEQCNIRFSGQSILANHMFDEHNTIDWLNCDMCGLKYKFLSSLNRHKGKIHGNSNNSVLTTNRNLYQRYYRSINKSMNTESKNTEVKIPTNVNKDCCLKKTTIQQKKMAMKQTTKNTVGSSQQNQAQMVHKSKVDLYKWAVSCLQNKIALKEIPVFVPKIRNNPVSVAHSTLNQPQTNRGLPYFVLDKKPSNNNIIPYECDLCGVMQMDFLSGLKHANLHCQYQHPCNKCNKEFYCASLLVEHKKQNHPIYNQFQCGHCDIWYKTKGSLQDHIHLTHMQPLSLENKCLILPDNIKNTPYCQLCKQVFNTDVSFEEHISYMHQIL